MFGSGVLDTAIGLLFVFLLVSLLVTIANELISSAMLSRAKWLQYGVVRLLGSEWAQRLYAHPLISSTTSSPAGKVDNKLPWRGAGPSYIPSRSFANVLVDLLRNGDKTLLAVRLSLQNALDTARDKQLPLEDLRPALMDAVSTATPYSADAKALSTDIAKLLGDIVDLDTVSRQWLSQLEGVAKRAVEPSLATLKQGLDALVILGMRDPSAQPLREQLKAAVDSVPYAAIGQAIRRDLDGLLARPGTTYTVGEARNDIQRFIDGMPARYMRQMIERIEATEVRDTLRVLMDDAQGDIDKFKQNIEIWFNNAMDRVGGWYKRRSQKVVGVLSLASAVLLNVDAMLVIRQLDTHAGMRDALVAQAKALAEKPPSGLARRGDKGAVANVAANAALAPSSTTSVTRTGAPAVSGTASATTQPAPHPSAGEGNPDPSGLGTQFADVKRQLRELSLPIGWVNSGSEEDKLAYRINPLSAGSFWETLRFHLLGWLITALAATLGAPFWFDTLNRLIAIRSAGKAPEETPKPPKDVPTPLEPGQTPREADAMKTRPR